MNTSSPSFNTPWSLRHGRDQIGIKKEEKKNWLKAHELDGVRKHELASGWSWFLVMLFYAFKLPHTSRPPPKYINLSELHSFSYRSN